MEMWFRGPVISFQPKSRIFSVLSQTTDDKQPHSQTTNEIYFWVKPEMKIIQNYVNKRKIQYQDRFFLKLAVRQA